MKKHFYSHLVETDSLFDEIHTLELTLEEKSYLYQLAESNLHHTILDAILSELSAEDKKIFLTYVAHNNHNQIWDHLNTKVDNIEDKIKKAAEEIKKELHKDLKTAKEIPEE